MLLDSLISLDAEREQHTVRLRLDRGAPRMARDQAHLADRRMGSETAHADRPAVFQTNADPDTAFENEMHRMGRIALGSDDRILLELTTLAARGQPIGQFGTAERLSEPFPQ